MANHKCINKNELQLELWQPFCKLTWLTKRIDSYGNQFVNLTKLLTSYGDYFFIN